MAQSLDVALTEGRLYADGGACKAYRWMCMNHPGLLRRQRFSRGSVSYCNHRHRISGRATACWRRGCAAFGGGRRKDFRGSRYLRIDRNPADHMVFGFSTHFCMGNKVARPELSTMPGRVLRRVADLRLGGDAEVTLYPASLVSGPEAMPVLCTSSRLIAK
jgi:hypothetical protein